MTIAKKLQLYLAEHGVEYDVLTHSPTPSASRTAESSHISGNRIAKGVVLKDEAGYLLALLPASHHIGLDEINSILGRSLKLATEEETSRLFSDCEVGAVPAIGAAYGLDVVMEESLARQPDIYFEGGDHTSLVHLSGEQFGKLSDTIQQGQFSHHQ